MDDNAFVPSFETERRFVVADTSFVVGAPWELLTQAYIFSLDGFAVRVRLTQHEGAGPGRAFVTAKGPRLDTSREEYEMEVSTDWARNVIARSANVIHKRRYQVLTDDAWEVDEFLDENAGLWIAELEGRPVSAIPRPAWARLELRNDDRFDNESLAVRPFGSWPASERTPFEVSGI